MEELEQVKQLNIWAERSESIKEIAAALVKAQGEVGNAKKDTANAFFKSKYADLASVKEAMREPFAKHGLAVLQEPQSTGNQITIISTVLHSSGEYMRSKLTMPVMKQDAQGYGSAITYARRYALAAIAGVAPEEDDGNAVSGNTTNGKHSNPASLPGIKTADSIQSNNAAAKKAFGDDNIPEKPQQLYRYDLRTYFASLKPAQANSATRLLEKAQGYDEGNDLWVVPEYVEGLKQFLIAEDSVEAA